eukprot:161958_1
MDYHSDCIELQRLQWNGIEELEKDDITNKIKVYQCSSESNGYEAYQVLNKNDQSWHSQSNFNDFVIFDTSRYEIYRISILFESEEKPNVMKLRMSEVGNAYSFNGIKSTHIFNLKDEKSAKINVWLKNNDVNESKDSVLN